MSDRQNKCQHLCNISENRGFQFDSINSKCFELHIKTMKGSDIRTKFKRMEVILRKAKKMKAKISRRQIMLEVLLYFCSLLSLTQMAGYPGPHTLPSVPSALYPPQATMMDTHHAHTHPRHHVHTHSHAQHLPQPHGHDMALWGSAMEVGNQFYTQGHTD